MKAIPPAIKTKNALILSGGGARAAYQVGVLKALAQLYPEGASNPFPIICGTSAGAIYGKDFQRAVTLLTRIWKNFHVHHVYRTDILGIIKNIARWLANLFRAGVGKHKLTPASLFDRTPLQELLNRHMPCERIIDSLKEDVVESICITASSYSTGKSTIFYQSSVSNQQWSRARRLARPTTINHQHLMASSAIPLVFSAVKVDNDYFGDGSMRQTAPLSPAIHLGADHLLVVGVTNKSNNNTSNDTAPEYPTLAQIGGHILNSIFVDSMEADLERIERINKTIRLIPSHHLEEHGLSLRPISVLVIDPSQDIQQIAAKHILSLPRSLRFLLRLLGASNNKGSSLVSYLMFEKEYCRELIDLGYTDAMARKQELIEFLGLEQTDSEKN